MAVTISVFTYEDAHNICLTSELISFFRSIDIVDTIGLLEWN